ncbi:TPA: hypothetical protein CPT89_01090 [Candidatus Gastranaerophilales bacterium HUM_11]|nr:MAG TPA: hypothetical protein CPT89_01090 [Candidatus Gastranaerophilales bacterium HUM_11]DAX39321.1 MAG TPA: hypothetical protein [Caudoviricetes sp.]
MLRAILRFLFCELPIALLSGLVFIIFDRYEIIGIDFNVRRFRNKNHNKKVICDYLEKCRKQVNETDRLK